MNRKVTMEEAMKRAQEYLNQKDFPLQETPLGSTTKKIPKRTLPDMDEVASGGCHR